jgi:hypothetical protein
MNQALYAHMNNKRKMKKKKKEKASWFLFYFDFLLCYWGLNPGPHAY